MKTSINAMAETSPARLLEQMGAPARA
ncbi:MAG: hypothetical protein JWQ76_5050, partial [Ramlibacter sp.]|nr:hypothetical protein [Ramlibacter sp.]